jgi:hypothetical protein
MYYRILACRRSMADGKSVAVNGAWAAGFLVWSLLSRFVNYLEGARGGRLLVDLFLPGASHVTLIIGGLVGPCRPVVSCGPATD